jgi:hypothetical protein
MVSEKVKGNVKVTARCRNEMDLMTAVPVVVNVARLFESQIFICGCLAILHDSPADALKL